MLRSEELSTYVIEILQEYGGQSIDKIAKGTISTPLIQVFNLMYQSAHALAFLHHTGTVHMDLKPTNIVYDKGFRYCENDRFWKLYLSHSIS